MPNTLAHIGIQTPLNRLGIQNIPLQWIMAGCIIPDIPWIVQRILEAIPGLDAISVKLYTTSQASLAFCLLLSLAIAMLVRNSRTIFLVLAGNSLLHLLLDAIQIKWGNGVQLFLPFSSAFTTFNLLWPEHFSSYLFSGIGFLIVILSWKKAICCDMQLQRPDRQKSLVLIICLLLYGIGPIPLIDDALANNIRYSQTLRNKEARTGQTILLGREYYRAETKTIKIYTGEELKITNPPTGPSTRLSIRGQFQDEHSITINELHPQPSFRDLSSFIGLLLSLLLWTHTFIHNQNNRQTRQESP